jgi:hypothetical protein
VTVSGAPTDVRFHRSQRQKRSVPLPAAGTSAFGSVTPSAARRRPARGPWLSIWSPPGGPNGNVAADGPGSRRLASQHSTLRTGRCGSARRISGRGSRRGGPRTGEPTSGHLPPCTSLDRTPGSNRPTPHAPVDRRTRPGSDFTCPTSASPGTRHVGVVTHLVRRTSLPRPQFAGQAGTARAVPVAGRQTPTQLRRPRRRPRDRLANPGGALPLDRTVVRCGTGSTQIVVLKNAGDVGVGGAGRGGSPVGGRRERGSRGA